MYCGSTQKPDARANPSLLSECSRELRIEQWWRAFSKIASTTITIELCLGQSATRIQTDNSPSEHISSPPALAIEGKNDDFYLNV